MEEVIPVITFCTHQYYWLLSPYAALFQKYFGNGMIICYGDRIPNNLPPNVEFRHVPGIDGDWDWMTTFGNGVSSILRSIDDPMIIMSLPDMWPVATVQLRTIELLGQYIKHKSNQILRILIGDDINLMKAKDGGLYAGKLQDTWHDIELFTAPIGDAHLGVERGLCLVPSIWNRELLLSLAENADIWEWEPVHNRKLAQSSIYSIWTRKSIYPFTHVCFRQYPFRVMFHSEYGLCNEDKSLVKSLLPEWVQIIEG